MQIWTIRRFSNMLTSSMRPHYWSNTCSVPKYWRLNLRQHRILINCHFKMWLWMRVVGKIYLQSCHKLCHKHLLNVGRFMLFKNKFTIGSMCYLYMIELVWTSCSTWNLRRSFSPLCQKWLVVFIYSLSILTSSKRRFSEAGNVTSSQSTSLNTERAE